MQDPNSSSDSAAGSSIDDGKRPWWRLLNGYHWFVLIVAAMGWLFDCLDQQLFVLARPAAMRDLLKGIDEDDFAAYSQRLLSSIPSATDAAPVQDWLDEAQRRLPDIERGRFWPVARELEAGAKSSEGRNLDAALVKARAGLAEAIDPVKFATSVRAYSGYATSIFLIGWAAGGLIFGVLGDRIGRAKVMMITILLYSAFTGLSALSVAFWDFALYRFLTGLGVGGEFAVGVALVAEVMPDRARPYTLALLQMLSTVGNITAALINMGMGVLEEQGDITSPWRKMFLIGALPALLAVVVRWKLREPERWQKVSHEGAVQKQLGSYAELLGNPRWRKNALIGLTLAFSGVVGLWAIGFFAPDLTDSVMKPQIEKNAVEELSAAAARDGNTQEAADLNQVYTLLRERKEVPAELKGAKEKFDASVNGRLTWWRGITSIMIQGGAFFGMFGFGMVAQVIGRRPTFLIFQLGAFFVTVFVFLALSQFWHLYVMMPIMGFFQLSLFAGYAMYFPELFPTHLRSTGTSFCYNVGRFVAASGPFVQGELSRAFEHFPDPLRYAGASMCVVFLIGLLVLPFAPETRNKPLPE